MTLPTRCQIIIRHPFCIPAIQLRAEYYNGAITGNPAYVTCDNLSFDHYWRLGGPGNGIGNDFFSARWVGHVFLPAGSYTFRVGADDGIRLWLDGALIINEWRIQGYTEYHTTRSFSTSTSHEIRVEYYENDGAARASFRLE